MCARDVVTALVMNGNDRLIIGHITLYTHEVS